MGTNDNKQLDANWTHSYQAFKINVASASCTYIHQEIKILTKPAGKSGGCTTYVWLRYNIKGTPLIADSGMFNSTVFTKDT